MIAFIISQYHDIWAFNFWMQKTNGKYLWLRNNLSTIASQLLDYIIFMFIAFYRTTPEMDVAAVFSMILPLWALKVIFALLDTPFIYLGVRWLASEDEKRLHAMERARKQDWLKVRKCTVPERIRA